jgi:hypothetical protein
MWTDEIVEDVRKVRQEQAAAAARARLVGSAVRGRPRALVETVSFREELWAVRGNLASRLALAVRELGAEVREQAPLRAARRGLLARAHTHLGIWQRWSARPPVGLCQLCGIVPCNAASDGPERRFDRWSCPLQLREKQCLP